jgi:hypothetical protein
VHRAGVDAFSYRFHTAVTGFFNSYERLQKHFRLGPKTLQTVLATKIIYLAFMFVRACCGLSSHVHLADRVFHRRAMRGMALGMTLYFDRHLLFLSNAATLK